MLKIKYIPQCKEHAAFPRQIIGDTLHHLEEGSTTENGCYSRLRQNAAEKTTQNTGIYIL